MSDVRQVRHVRTIFKAAQRSVQAKLRERTRLLSYGIISLSFIGILFALRISSTEATFHAQPHHNANQQTSAHEHEIIQETETSENQQSTRVEQDTSARSTHSSSNSNNTTSVSISSSQKTTIDGGVTRTQGTVTSNGHTVTETKVTTQDGSTSSVTFNGRNTGECEFDQSRNGERWEFECESEVDDKR